MEPQQQQQLMPIGRFARLTGLTVKALRHYDELGLLRPASIDPDTGYRFYAAAQVHRAETIRTLRRLEVPLDDISMLLVADDRAEVRRLLVDHQRRTALRSAELKVILQGLQPLIDGKEPVMGTPAEALDRETHRRLGIDLFNKTWTLMEKQDRTARKTTRCSIARTRRRITGFRSGRRRIAPAASGSARAYTVLGRAGAGALHHAQRCLAIVEESPAEMEEFDLPVRRTKRSPARARGRGTQRRGASLRRAREDGDGEDRRRRRPGDHRDRPRDDRCVTKTQEMPFRPGRLVQELPRDRPAGLKAL